MSSPAPARLPGPSPARPGAASPALAAGLRVVRRGRDRVQVGLTEPRRTVLPRTAAVERVLDALQRGEAPADDPATATVLDTLHDHGCLAAPAYGLPATSGPLVALRPAVRELPVDPEQLLVAAGLRPTRWEHRAEAVLVVSDGEPAREPLDPLLRDGVPHLLLSFVDGGARLGPFVVPGRTACQRCLDSHLGEDDPEHLAVLTRYVEATAAPRPDGRDDLDDPGLVTLAVGWAVREVAAYLRGDEPATWSTTLTWHAGAPHPVTRRWLRRPGCGCGWAVSGTMDP